MGGSGCTASDQCGTCAGDCDADGDCQPGLKCFQRDTIDATVPGCPAGGSGDIGTHDYCYDHGANFDSLVDLGGSGCTSADQCGTCAGDCDADTDCQPGLKCFQRDTTDATVPGCPAIGSGDIGTHDYCYDHGLRKIVGSVGGR